MNEWLANGRNGTAAHEVAYPGRSSRHVRENEAQRILKRPHMVAAIAEADKRVVAAQERAMKKLEVNQERVLHEFARIAFGDLRDMFDEAGNLRHPHELDDDAAARIAAIDVVVRPKPGGERGEVEYVHKLKAWDKVNALTQLGRHLGMFKDNMNLTGGINITISPDDDKL